MEKIASCIKERGNWGSALTKELRFDSDTYSPDKVRALLASASPKLHTLVQKIKELDAKDMKEHGRVYKHFIYSDIKSGYGAKLIASILQAHDFEHAYRLKKTTRGMSFALDLKKKDAFKTFAILTSVAFFEKPIGVTFRRELLKTFNDRPSNIYGEKIRIMVLDSGFREGLDLFDIKYVHVVEPITTLNDQKQAVGRATRFCGQKGLKFDPVRGWPLHVFRYETTVPAEIKEYLEKQLPEIASADDFFQMFLKFSNIDPKKIAFSNELERVAIDNAVDKEYTKALHEFKVAGGKKDYIWPPVKVENLCLDAAPASSSRSSSASSSASEIAPAPGKAAAAAQPAGQVVTFSPTQNFVREYFTPANPLHGMLLFHSIGTGKTCTAIATASSSFEAEDYSIMYVTRYTLKPDVWKNMFGQVCSVVVQDYLRKNKKLPESHAARLRLISKKWMEPMSYRQLSNTLDGKNKLHDILVKNNGAKDPLHKTLLIIDEAHKLFAADVEGQEKADIDVIKKALQHSYATSGKDSVKVLMMTATPYTSDAMDMIRVMNLILKKPLPEDFDQFSAEFLNEEGKFSAAGLVKFRAQMEGSVSYLNREKDIRSFAYPVFHEIRVAMSDYEFKDTLVDYLEYKQLVSGKISDYNNEVVNTRSKLIGHRLTIEKMHRHLITEKEKELNECLNKNTLKMELSDLKNKFRDQLKKCKDTKDECKKRIHKDHVERLKEMRKELKTQSLKKTKEEKKLLKEAYAVNVANLEIDKDYDLQECDKDIDVVECEEKARVDYERKTREAKDNVAIAHKHCDVIKEQLETLKSDTKKIVDQKMEKHHKYYGERLQISEKRIKGFRETLAEKNIKMETEINADVSQRSGLEKCLKNKNYVPAYKDMLKEFVDIDDNIDIQENGVDDEKIYLISGHGSERLDKGFEKRVVMPKDKLLVVFPECGRPNYLTTACKFQDIFMNPNKRELLRNPIKNQREIRKILGHDIRIYLPGEYVPSLSTNLFLNFNKDKLVLAKSGVFRSFPPMDRSILKEGTSGYNLGTDRCLKYSGIIDNQRGYTSAVHKQVFLGNIYPPASKGKNYKEIESHSFSIMDIMKDIGIGIYYYIGCRSSYNIPKDYEEILDKSDAQQKALKRVERVGSLEKKLYGIEEEKDKDKQEDDSFEDTHSRSSSDKNKNKKEEKPKKKKISPDEKNKLLSLSSDVEELYNEITSDIKQIGKYTEKRAELIEKYRHALNELSASPARKKIEATLDWIEVILKTSQDDLEYTFQSETIEDKKYIQLSVGYQFTKNKVKKIFYDSLYGFIPTDVLDKEDKCTSTGLVKRIKLLFDKGVRIKLPTELKAWTDAQTKNICRETRTLLTTAK